MVTYFVLSLGDEGGGGGVGGGELGNKPFCDT